MPNFKKKTSVSVRDIALNYLECAKEPMTVDNVLSNADWSRSKNGVIHRTYLAKVLCELAHEGWIMGLERLYYNDPISYEYVGNPDLVIKPKEPVKAQLSTPIVPPRKHEFVPYVPEAQPAYRAGAFDFLKHASVGVF